MTPVKNALMGAATAALIAAPAAADLNFFWTYSAGDNPGEVVNTLNFISTANSFSAGLYAQTLPLSPFIDPSGDLMPDAGSDSFFSGGFEINEAGYEDPILIGAAPLAGGTPAGPLTLSGGTIDATWISNWPEDSFPTGDIADPIKGGQFTLDNSAEGSYGFRLANSEEVVLHLTGVIDNGRFSQRLPGDVDLDNDVDIDDLGIVAGNWQQSVGGYTDGDIDGDGDVDIDDLGLLAGNWQAGVGAPAQQGFDAAVASVGIAVPEPGSLALLGLGGLFLGYRRRRA